MKHWMRENGLSVATILLFVLAQVALTFAGWKQHNDDQLDHGKTPIPYTDYLVSDDFLETTMENWESEFLQMFIFVVLTTHLYQRGSAASKKPDAFNEVDEDPRLHSRDPNAPWPVRKGGWVLALYERSLGLAFLILFFISFVWHAIAGAGAYSQERIEHGKAAVTAWQYLFTAQFWFESLQNWQSEFLALAAMVILSVFLRQRYSPESKPVACPHGETP